MLGSPIVGSIPQGGSGARELPIKDSFFGLLYAVAVALCPPFRNFVVRPEILRCLRLFSIVVNEGHDVFPRRLDRLGTPQPLPHIVGQP